MRLLTLYNDLEKQTMTESKRKMAKNDIFAFYIGRPISYWISMLFLPFSITPNQISYISLIPLIFAALIMCIATHTSALYCSWVLFFVWNILDGVDGNIARYKKQFSDIGSVVDAMIGYVAMFLTFFSVGIAASNIENTSIYIILGALSGVSLIFPRLIMHKYINTVGLNNSAESIKNKGDFSLLKILALNLTSITGFPQVLLLLAIAFDQLHVYTIFYFFINVFVMLASLNSLLKE